MTLNGSIICHVPQRMTLKGSIERRQTQLMTSNRNLGLRMLVISANSLFSKGIQVNNAEEN